LRQALLYYLRPATITSADINKLPDFIQKVENAMAAQKLIENNLTIASIQQYLNDTISNIKVSMKEFDFEWLNSHKIKEIDEITKAKISGLDDLIKYLTIATKNRLTRKTVNNPESSRSHLFLLFTLTSNGSSVKLMISDLAGSENPFEYCGIAAIEGFYILNSLNQIKTAIGSYSNCDKDNISNCSVQMKNAPVVNGLSLVAIINKNFNKETSKFASDLEYSGTGEAKLIDIQKVLVNEIFNKQTAITYTFLNIKGYMENKTLNLKQDLINTLKMVGGLKKISYGFGRRIIRKVRTSRKRAKAVQRRGSKEQKKRRSKKKSKSKKRRSTRRS